MVLVGMQPVFTQVPPKSLRSMTATCIPVPAKRLASEGPAWPAPMMMASHGRVMRVCQIVTRMARQGLCGLVRRLIDCTFCERPLFMKKAIIYLAMALALTLPAAADFEAGLKAYQNGDYATALKEWQPLAE